MHSHTPASAPSAETFSWLLYQKYVEVRNSSRGHMYTGVFKEAFFSPFLAIPLLAHQFVVSLGTDFN